MFRRRAILAIIVSFIVVGTTTFGTIMYLNANDLKIYLRNQYHRSLFQLISDMEQIQVSLSKVPVTVSSKQNVLLLGDIWRQSNSAEEEINALPISHTAISQTNKFLTQVADFSYAMMKTSNNGESLSQLQIDNVEKLKNYSNYLSSQLKLLEQQISEGKLDWTEIRHDGRSLMEGKTGDSINTIFSQMSDSIQQYPTLIYDGPFSENVLNIRPKVLAEPEITLDRAKEIAASIVGTNNVSSITQYSTKSGERIPNYSLSVNIKNNSSQKSNTINMDISKNGGHIVYMLNPRDVNAAKIGMKDAINKGLQFLDRLGYKSMIPSFSLRYDNVAVVNYVYVQNSTVIYPDQIKLKIALDNGEITGVESQNYLISHTVRTIPKPRITMNEARRNVNDRLSINNARLCIIPMESQKELLCYEFYGTYNGEKYMTYINALNGVEERILKIISTPNGELSM